MHHVSRPTLGFPLGTALLLIIIFCLSGVFSCCYHWEKLRSLCRRRHGSSLPTTAATAQHQQDSSIPLSTSKLSFKQQDAKQQREESLPVIMPGDRFPKYMAWPCSCPLSTTTAAADATNAAAAATVITFGVLLLPSPSPPAPSHS